MLYPSSLFYLIQLSNSSSKQQVFDSILVMNIMVFRISWTPANLELQVWQGGFKHLNGLINQLDAVYVNNSPFYVVSPVTCISESLNPVQGQFLSDVRNGNKTNDT